MGTIRQIIPLVMTWIRTRVALAVFAAAAMSCGDSTGLPAAGSLEVDPSTATILVDEARQFSANVRSVSGATIMGAPVVWRSTADVIAAVSPAGMVVGVNAGSVLIIAKSGPVADTSEVTVAPVTFPPPPVATVDVQPTDSVEVETGASAQLVAIPRSVTGAPLVNRTIVWTSADPATVEITSDGLITPIKAGRVTISATSEGRVGSTLAIAVQPPRDFAIADAQITQAVQLADQSIPMVEGKHAAINVLLTASPSKPFPMEVTLRVTDAGGALRYASTVSATASVVGTATFAAPNAQFLVPDTLVRLGMAWQVTRDPRGRVADDTPENDVFPPAGPRIISAVSVPPMSVRVVRFMFNGEQAGAPNVNARLSTVRAVYPVGTVLGSLRSQLLVSSASPTEDYWSVMLAELDVARLLENSANPDEYWLGSVPPPVQDGGVWPPDMQTGLSYAPADPESNGPGTRSAVAMNADWNGFELLVAATIAHEVGHWFGRMHAPCSPTVTHVDQAYPYAGGVIGVLGHNVASLAGGGISAIPQSPTTLDISGPCNTSRWVSDYTYLGVLAWRGYTPRSVAARRAPRAPIAPTVPLARSLIVRGRVSEAGAVDLEPAFVTDARAMRPERRGPYRLEVRDADGRVLVSDEFAPAMLSHRSGGHFLFAIPISTDIESAMGSIEVRGPVSRAQRVRSIVQGSLSSRDMVPVLRRTSAGYADISCADATTRGILIRDANTGSLIAVGRSASAAFAAPPGKAFAVTCSDGVASTTATVVAR